jgi:ubiquinone biosynthesis monooxygenase Coq7
MSTAAVGAGETSAELPGDPSEAELVARILRVDHAGEYGAVRIYEGQLAVLGGSAAGAVIRRMAAQEQRHLEAFNRMLPQRQVRPTALSPLWHVAGFALGAATALLGERAAMACTVAVEDVIDKHYADQVAALGEREPELKTLIEDFRRDELAHRDEGIAHGAEQAPGYEMLAAAIKAGSRLAIWLSTRI